MSEDKSYINLLEETYGHPLDDPFWRTLCKALVRASNRLGISGVNLGDLEFVDLGDKCFTLRCQKIEMEEDL